jgi:hypothetical protein
VSYLGELRDTIRHLHGGEATHIESVPVKETHEGQIVWEGIVEGIDLHGHPKANRVYAWAHEVNNPGRPDRHIAVLRGEIVNSPAMAVRAAIVQEFRNLEPEES